MQRKTSHTKPSPMASVNKVIILGNLGKDPEVSYVAHGRMRVLLVLATHNSYKTKEGEQIRHTEWHEIILWTPLAEIAARYLNKGKQVYIEGKLSYRCYRDREGQQKQAVQIIGQQLVLLGNPKTDPLEGNIAIAHHPPRSLSNPYDMDELPL